MKSSSLPRKTSAVDMTSGSIVRQVIMFSLPLMFGNVFQMLYNTVDSIVVGNYVSTQALAAVGSTNFIINMMVFFFNGFSVGAGVVIGNAFGARELDKLHRTIETTAAMTIILSLALSLLGYLGVPTMLRLMSTPEDVIPEATTYLRIYFAGLSGLLIYNIGSGILRAVGDTVRPLFFLVLTSVLNIILDLLFVLVFKAGIAGVALATILAQFVSAGLTLLLLTRTQDIYRLDWKDLQLDKKILKQIFSVGLPAGIQSVLTSFSNIFVQSYINTFGSSCMAGWSCYNKLDQFIMLPMQSMAMAATTFVSQNMGAKKFQRANLGTVITIGMCFSITAVIASSLFIFSRPAVGLFTSDPGVIDFGVLFIRTNVFFLLFNCVNHTLAGALRGQGDSKAPMIFMLSTFVVIRQIYLYIMTHFIMNTPQVVGLGYPVGWVLCFLLEVSYFLIKWKRGPVDAPAQAA